MGKITNNDPIPEFPTFFPLENFGNVVVEYDSTITEVSSDFAISKDGQTFLVRVSPDFGQGSISNIDAFFVTIPGYAPDDFGRQIYQGETEAPFSSSQIIVAIDLDTVVEDVIKPGVVLLLRIRWAKTIG